MTQKKMFNWIRHICNSLLKCKNDEEAMKYKDEFNKLADNKKGKEKVYGKNPFIANSYDVNNGLEALNLYFNHKEELFVKVGYNINLLRLQTEFIPKLLKGLNHGKEEL